LVEQAGRDFQPFVYVEGVGLIVEDVMRGFFAAL
jgi:hypothetical protein